MLAAFLHTNSDSYTISSTTTSPQVSGSKSCTLFLHPPLTGNLNVPLKLPRRERSLPSPPFLLPGVLNPQVLQALPVLSHSFSMTPFTSNDGMPPGCLVAALCIPFQVGCPWIAAPYLFLRRHPLTTLGRPPPTAVAESQWGEPRSDAFGTGVRVAVSISLWPVLLPIVSVGEEEGGAGWEWQTSSSSPGHGASSDASYTLCRCRVKEHDLTFGEDAAMVLGLQILCIINEPKAAAITYGLDKKSRRTERRERACSGAFCEKETLATEGKVRVYEAGTTKAARQNYRRFLYARARIRVTTHHVYRTEAAYGGISSILKPSNPLIAVPIVSSPSHITVAVANVSSSPLHCVTVTALIGVTRLALAECLGGGRGILIGVVVGMSCRAPLSGDVSKPNK
ncbi:hypothetical protein EDB85DRAFT_1900656 [Lactarius pseudohatsudake]|nr:hypothetical protein EDB85DRAFT_1900656 [Lactarius pseudohatsudake]